MRRKLLLLLVCMPLCLFFVPDRTPVVLSVPTPSSSIIEDDGKALANADEAAQLAETDAVAFLELALRHQIREVHGYSGVLRKTERLGGKEHPLEVIDFWFREKPYSVLMKWRQGARNGKASLYVEGQNRDRVTVLPNTRIAFPLDIDPDGRLAQGGGRYSIREFSLRQGTERTLRAWKAAKEKGILQVEYLGKKPVPELDDRICYLLRRTCNPPEEEGVVTVSIAIDAETWLQTGSELIDGQGKLIGRYHITQLKVNPTFAANQFDRSQLK